jgi:uncharacterized protein YjiS (DUF1127 family)
MAITRSRSRLDVLIDAGCAFFHQTRDNLRAELAKREVYRKTHHELSMLTDRDLADLGIARSNIKAIALEAANGV